MNLGELRTRISAVTGLDNTASSTEQGYIDNWVNEGIVRFQELAPRAVYHSSFQLTLTAAVADYDLPDLIEIVSMDITPSGASNTYPLERLSVDDIMDVRRPTSTSQFPRYWSVLGENMLLLAPTPSAADTINGYYIPRASAMTASTHDPSSSTYGGIPKQYHDALELYGKWKAAEYSDNVSSKNGQVYLQQWEMRMREIRRASNRKGGAKLRTIKIGKRSLNKFYGPGIDDGS